MHRPSVVRRSSNATIVIDYPWTKTKEDTASFYKVDEAKGLSEERVRQDLERYGPNGKIPEKKNHVYNIFSYFTIV